MPLLHTRLNGNSQHSTWQVKLRVHVADKLLIVGSPTQGPFKNCQESIVKIVDKGNNAQTAHPLIKKLHKKTKGKVTSSTKAKTCTNRKATQKRGNMYIVL